MYSLWDSMREIMGWLEEHAPDALPAAHQAWQCFEPFQEDPHRYAWNTRIVDETCEADAVDLLWLEDTTALHPLGLSND